ncbi:MAG: hypothetical protein ACTSQZ_04045, partial [Candidatus Thorarchaeota archaeon]
MRRKKPPLLVMLFLLIISGFAIIGSSNLTLMMSETNPSDSAMELSIRENFPPEFTSWPADFEMEYGDSGWVNFTATDADNPHCYELYFDSTTLYSEGTWTSPFSKNSSLGDPDLGVHNFTAWLNDTFTASTVETCIITVVDTTPATITGPADFEFEAGTTPSVSWSWDEDLPSNYSIYENNTEVVFSDTFPPSDIEHDLEDFSPGLYNITLAINDTSGNLGTDEVWVTVVDTTAPDLEYVGESITELGETTLLNWSVSNIDSWDQDGNWIIYSNDSILTSGIWDESYVEYSATLPLGVSNITLLLEDDNQNEVVNTTWVTITDTTSPLLTYDGDTSTELGESTLLNWTVSNIEDGDQVGSWIIFSNGSNIASGDWDSSFVEFTTLLSLGVNNLTLYLEDKSGNDVKSTKWITVEDSTPPIISAPVDVEFTEGESGFWVNWTGSDNDPGNYEV